VADLECGYFPYLLDLPIPFAALGLWKRLVDNCGLPVSLLWMEFHPQFIHILFLVVFG